MLARLQKILTLAILAAAAFWAAVWTLAGYGVWAAIGAAFIVGGHALVLGLEFLLLSRVHGDDPTPRATHWQLLCAWAGEVKSALVVFCWRQPFRSRRWPDLLPAAGRGRRGVLLVHGFVCNRGIWNPWLQRLQAAGVPFVAVNLEPVFGSIDDYAPQIERAVRALEACTGLPPVVVGHSMGGLVLRRWWDEHGDDKRVHRAITIGTPHSGTWLARFAMSMNSRQMRRPSAWLQALAGREPLSRARRYVCFYGHCDNIVFPPTAATLPGADNRHLAAVAHLCMVDRREPWAELQRALAEPPTPAAAPPTLLTETDAAPAVVSSRG